MSDKNKPVGTAARIAARRATEDVARREAENNVLRAYATLPADDQSSRARQLRETARSIVEHRECETRQCGDLR